MWHIQCGECGQSASYVAWTFAATLPHQWRCPNCRCLVELRKVTEPWGVRVEVHVLQPGRRLTAAGGAS